MSKTDLILKSFYVPMRDGVRLAVSAWLAGGAEFAAPHPAVLMTTRYWRAMAFRQDKPECQDSFPMAEYLWQRGYVLIIGDARGTGASFGTREMEIPPNELLPAPTRTCSIQSRAAKRLRLPWSEIPVTPPSSTCRCYRGNKGLI